MKFTLEPGRYVVAVSGGVDSCVLLHLLHSHQEYELIVAHFDHGIRPESAADATFVESLAAEYSLPYVSERAELGALASEADARKARYLFLHKVLSDRQADAIVTAHHQDDVLETAVLNIMRGTGRLGLSALRDRPDIRRPLLGTTKRELLQYAKTNMLNWREDSTNTDNKYLRNYVRNRLMPKIDDENRKSLLGILNSMRRLNDELDAELSAAIDRQSTDSRLHRSWFNSLPHPVAREVMAAWLRQYGLQDFDSKALERLVVAGKVTQPGKQIDILHSVRLRVEKDMLALSGLER